ncbi:ECF transporter S component [Apilactobacillus bombintestini]|uniref:Riboflavin transporter n=1 Tax=Apilactobacillus bombintestini TaxID=2419772 RepID=A0A387ATA7_9LACO|nr:ECF transporter S component [Apilactobacillus bombintestini]AYF92551.1 ECF transporter S component [Apilactobacillus bombintestini]
MTNSHHLSLRKLVQVSILGGLAYLLTYLSVPIIPIAPYMKLDFGDIPILLATVLLSTRSGIVVALLRSLLYFIFTGISVINLIGVSSLLVASLTIIFSVTIIDQLLNSKIKYVAMIILETLSLTVIMSLMNYFIITPLYMQLTGFKLSFSLSSSIIYIVVPFNIIKGLFIGIIFVLLIKHSKTWEKYREKG